MPKPNDDEKLLPPTTKLDLTLTVELVMAVKQKAFKLFGRRKGAISHYVEMVLRNDLHLKQKDVEES